MICFCVDFFIRSPHLDIFPDPADSHSCAKQNKPVSEIEFIHFFSLTKPFWEVYNSVSIEVITMSTVTGQDLPKKIIVVDANGEETLTGLSDVRNDLLRDW